VQNALAGGSSFITLPSLMLTGMDARGQHHLDSGAVSGAARHRIHRSGGRGNPDWAHDAASW
jgi:hypothetical protein